MSELRRNLELKVAYPDLAGARQVMVRLGVKEHQVQVQTDTYFCAPNGRLKLREIEGRTAELIWYERPNNTDVRASRFYVVPTPDATGTKAALAAALGVRGEVRKRREIYLWHNVRVHLDEVNKLGSFIEFEAVMTAGEDDATSNARLSEPCRLLAIDRNQTLAGSYSDLLGL